MKVLQAFKNGWRLSQAEETAVNLPGCQRVISTASLWKLIGRCAQVKLASGDSRV